ncbi:hypothetical protein J2W42_002347 [Rhizobium tibeticum]|uniref:Transmembrane protein n=1 Tax=Rhizobium tibeticum TaxID=501024 RepID=A0A1H8RJ94_9HYPH|nr:hypothetical protein [Rhizobium tibeticum]MDP9809495.1 hypothetical protein [Rhizobium tibeticum]SEI06790.1 hypothetical protein RTCCBAU85039_4161 [Rhizobium tibeticum]SEO66083.1 hypothetical protein SAMN05216228_1021124 [Rhizobium tibeticum]
MYRFALSKMLFFVRLVIIVSLAGYTFSNANAAMHGSAFPELQTSVEIGTHDHHSMSAHDHQASDTAADHHDDQSNADDSGIAKQECCKDFCGGFGIVCEAPDVGGPVLSSIREFVNDQSTLGELPPLHRPPNI